MRTLALLPALLLAVTASGYGRVVTKLNSDCHSIVDVSVSVGLAVDHVTFVKGGCNGLSTIESYICPHDDGDCVLFAHTGNNVVTSFDSTVSSPNDFTMTAFTSEETVHINCDGNKWVAVDSNEPTGVTTTAVSRALFTLWAQGQDQVRYRYSTPDGDLYYGIVECASCSSARVLYLPLVKVLFVTLLQGPQTLLVKLIDSETGEVTLSTQLTVNPHAYKYGIYDMVMLSDGRTVTITIPVKNDLGEWELYLTTLSVLGKDEVTSHGSDLVLQVPGQKHQMNIQMASLQDNEFLVGYEGSEAIEFHGGRVVDGTIEVFNVTGVVSTKTTGTLQYDIKGTMGGFTIAYSNGNELLHHKVANVTAFVLGEDISETAVPQTLTPRSVLPSSNYDDDGHFGTLLVLVAIVMPVVFITGMSVVVWVCFCYGRDTVVQVNHSKQETADLQLNTIGIPIPDTTLLTPTPVDSPLSPKSPGSPK